MISKEIMIIIRGVKMKRGIILLIILLLSVVASPVFADTIISNSKDWRDVYSVMLYGQLIGSGSNSKFLVSEKHSTIILYEVPKDQPVEAYSSTRQPYIVGYKQILESNGYQAEEFTADSFNLYLAKKLTDINSYIIIDDSYSYNGIAVAPYAALTKSYVIFADKGDIGQVSSFLATKKVEKVLIYGYVDREVRSALAKYNLEIINKDNDKFENVIEIVKKYKAIKDAKQVSLTDGEFIEASLMSDFQPTLFTGRQNVPDDVKEYIKSSNIEVGVLIGNELVGTATMIRRETGISTFVKYARSARVPTGTVSQVEGLDLFLLPPINLNISLESIKYNTLTKKIYVTVKNTADVSEYLKGSYTIRVGGKSYAIGDTDPVFIEAGSRKTIIYDIDPLTSTENITADVFLLFGESKKSLEYKMEGTVMVGTIDVSDDSSIDIIKAEYGKDDKKIYVSIKNTGSSDVFVNSESADVTIIDTKNTYGSESVIKIPAGATKQSIIKADMSDEDLANNQMVKIRAYYGKSEESLAKIAEKEVALEVKALSLMLVLPLVIIILLIIIIVTVIIKKRKDV